MNDASNFVLVTGATGAVGPRVVQALVAAGYRVRTLSLDDPDPGTFPSDVKAQIGDITNPDDLQTALQGVDGVIHLAALLHITNPPPALRQQYEQVNVGGTAKVVAAAQKTNVKRVVLFSTIAVYGDSRGQVLDESSPTNPETLYAQTKAAAEQIVLQAQRRDGKPLGTVLRFGAVYGARIKGNYSRLVQAIARNRFLPVGRGHNRRTLIYDRDVAAAAVLALRHPAAAGQVFNVSDGEFYTLNQIIAAISSALSKKPPPFSIPTAPVRLAAGLLEDGARMLGRRAPIIRATIDKYTEDIAVSSQRIRTELGFHPQYDLQSGWGETIQEMRQQGGL